MNVNELDKNWDKCVLRIKIITPTPEPHLFSEYLLSLEDTSRHWEWSKSVEIPEISYLNFLNIFSSISVITWVKEEHG